MLVLESIVQLLFQRLMVRTLVNAIVKQFVYHIVYSSGTLAVSLNATSTTSLTVSWTLATDVTATNFTISYSNTDTQCFNDSNDITGIGASETMYNVTGLQEGTEYSITVTAMLSDGGSGEDSLTASTMATG